MDIKLCDRCGKEITSSFKAVKIRSLWLSDDLCPECYDELMRWFKNGKAPNGKSRTCICCGMEVKDAGFAMDGNPDWYCHEKCFTHFMNSKYGLNCWMMTSDDECGGHYIVNDPEYEFPKGTGIYWTTWEDEE